MVLSVEQTNWGLAKREKKRIDWKIAVQKLNRGFGCFSLGTKQRRLKSKIKVNKPKGSLMVVWINKTKIKNERKKKSTTLLRVSQSP